MKSVDYYVDRFIDRFDWEKIAAYVDECGDFCLISESRILHENEWQALEEVAEDFGLYVYASDCDGCDIFVGSVY
jgi:hypothetical protein